MEHGLPRLDLRADIYIFLLLLSKTSVRLSVKFEKDLLST